MTQSLAVSCVAAQAASSREPIQSAIVIACTPVRRVCVGFWAVYIGPHVTRIIVPVHQTLDSVVFVRKFASSPLLTALSLVIPPHVADYNDEREVEESEDSELKPEHSVARIYRFTAKLVDLVSFRLK